MTFTYRPEDLIYPSLQTKPYEPNPDLLGRRLSWALELIQRSNAVEFQNELAHPEPDQSQESADPAWKILCDQSYQALWRPASSTWNKGVVGSRSFGDVVQLKLLGHSWGSIEHTLRYGGEVHTASAELVLNRFLLLCHWLHDNPDLLYTLGYEYTPAWTSWVQRYEPKTCDESWPSYACLRTALVEKRKLAANNPQHDLEVKKPRGAGQYVRYLDQANFFDLGESQRKIDPVQSKDTSAVVQDFQRLSDSSKEIKTRSLVALALKQERELAEKMSKVRFAPDNTTPEDEKEVEQFYDAMLKCYSAGGIGTGKTLAQKKMLEQVQQELARPIGMPASKIPELTLNFKMDESAKKLFDQFDPFTKSKVALDSLYKKNYVDSKERPATDILRAYTLFSPACSGDTPLTLTCGPYAGFKIADLKVKHELSGAYRATFDLSPWKCACGGLMRSELAWYSDHIGVFIHCKSCGKAMLNEELLTCNPELRFRDFVNIVEWALTTAKVLNDSKCYVFPVATVSAPSVPKEEVETIRKALLPTKRKRKNKEGSKT